MIHALLDPPEAWWLLTALAIRIATTYTNGAPEGAPPATNSPKKEHDHDT